MFHALFGCKHPFESLTVMKPSTRVKKDPGFITETYYFKCDCCGKLLEKKTLTIDGTPEDFLSKPFES